jgi:uncharacterized protein YqeY
MDLLTRLQEDMKTALKNGERDRLSVIRMLLSDVKNIDLMPGKPSAEQVVEAYGKKLRKSLEEYQKLGRTDEVEKLKKEIEVVESYLPRKLDRGQTEPLVAEFLASHSFTAAQVGQAMGLFLKQHGSKVDPAVVSALLREKLQ